MQMPIEKSLILLIFIASSNQLTSFASRSLQTSPPRIECGSQQALVVTQARECLALVNHDLPLITEQLRAGAMENATAVFRQLYGQCLSKRRVINYRCCSMSIVVQAECSQITAYQQSLRTLEADYQKLPLQVRERFEKAKIEYMKAFQITN